MIKCRIISGVEIYINPANIESLEASPDTTIKIHDGTTYVVKEKPEEIVEAIRAWHRSLREKSV